MSGNVASNRQSARIAAVQALFQAEQAGQNAETVIVQFERHRFDGADWEDGGAPDAHKKLFAQIVRAAVEGQDRLDQLIAEKLPETWPLMRLDPVLRALLRAGAAELLNRDGPPVAVVINEYMDVAHRFFTGDEPKLTNAMLQALATQLRPVKGA
jgi:N utilization substance protein B